MVNSDSPYFNAFTIDVEDYFHVSAFERFVDKGSWPKYDCRVERNTHRILDILDEHGVRGTFFVLGWVAEHYPEMVAEIHRRGHEIGSHSYWHRLIYELSPDEFRADLRQSIQVLEDITQVPVTCFRAPSFSITPKSLWALEVLVEEGIQVDSSIFPVAHDRYGMPNARREIHSIRTPSGLLWEFPPSVSRFLNYNLPISGGGYFRLYPFSLSARWLGQVNRGTRTEPAHPFMFYLHPWEIDPDQPRMPHGGRLSRWRHYVNLSRTESKLRRLLTRFRFDTMAATIQQLHPHFSSRSHHEQSTNVDVNDLVHAGRPEHPTAT